MNENDHAALDTNAAPQTALAESKGRKAKARKKVRSAWISFVGRITAQLIGACATIFLGLIVVDKYRDAHHAETPAAPPVMRQLSGLPALAVLPVQDYSQGAGHGAFASALTEALVAQFAQSSSVRVLSRTSSMAYKDTSKSLPAIGRELGVEWIVESSIVRDGGRIRLVAQLIDARTDEHVLARVYDKPVRDLLAVQTALAAEVAADVNAALTKPPVRLAAGGSLQ